MMVLPPLLAAAGLMLAGPCTGVAQAADTPASAPAGTQRTVTSTLDCGTARLTAVSRLDPHAPPSDSYVWFEQQLSLKPAAQAISRPLSVDPAPAVSFAGKRQRLPRAVYSWACVPAGAAQYFVLMLNCTRDDLGDDRRGVCHGQREWLRIIDTQGRRPDAGYKPQDPRYEALMRRLGIPDSLPMQAVVE